MAISEVAQLRERIRLEYEAAHRALHGPAIVGKHAIISKHMENIQASHALLQTLVGEYEAIKLVAATLDGALQ
jgi:hypothetical protein